MRNTTHSTRAAAIALLLTSLGTVAGCGSSNDSSGAATATTTATRAAAAPGASGVCGTPPASPSVTLTMANATTEEITWRFSGVDCTRWLGRTPMMPENTPLTLAPGESRTIGLNPACAPPTFTASLYRPQSANPERVQRTVRLSITKPDCKDRRGDAAMDPTTITMAAQDEARPSATAPWVTASTVRVATGGRSWTISAGTNGYSGSGVRVAQ